MQSVSTTTVVAEKEEVLHHACDSGFVWPTLVCSVGSATSAKRALERVLGATRRG